MLLTSTLLEWVVTPYTFAGPYMETFDRIALDAPNCPATETLLATTLERVLTFDTAKLPLILTFEVIETLAPPLAVTH